MKIIPQMEASGIMPQLSVRVMPRLSESGSRLRMSRLRVWSGQLEYPAAGFITLYIPASAASSVARICPSSHVEAASASVFIIERSIMSS